MADQGWIIAVCIAIVIGVVISIIKKNIKRSKMTPEQKQAEDDARDLHYVTLQFGELNPALFCPHCKTKGSVRAMAISRKKGISGGKVVGAFLTGGISMLATGLSRKEGMTQAHCMNCGSTWDF